MGTVHPTPGRFWRQFMPIFGAGVVGITGLVPVIVQQFDNLPPNLPISPPVLVTLLLLQTTVLVAVAAAAGTGLAPHLGLRSDLAAWALGEAPPFNAIRPVLLRAAGLGLACATVIVGLDLALRPLMPPEFLTASANAPGGVSALVSGLLYGGITEEIFMRWGLLSLLAWAGWQLLQRGAGRPHPAIMWGAILLAALIFGLGHVPAVAALASLTPALVVRTVLLNSLAGVAAGWLFWRHSLEAAMIAHMAVHVGFAIARLLGAAA